MLVDLACRGIHMHILILVGILLAVYALVTTSGHCLGKRCPCPCSLGCSHPELSHCPDQFCLEFQGLVATFVQRLVRMGSWLYELTEHCYS